jgi:hypothetical protein
VTTINNGVLDGVRRIGPTVRDLGVSGGIAGAPLGMRLKGATVSGPPAVGTWKAGDQVTDRAGAIWVCTVSGTPGTWVQSGGGGGGAVDEVTAADASVDIGGTTSNPTVATGSLAQIAAAHPAASAVPFNGQKATGLASGSASGDAVTYGQLGTAAFQASGAFDAAGSAATAQSAAEAASLPLPSGGGYPSGTTEFLRGDGSWVAPTAGGGSGRAATIVVAAANSSSVGKAYADYVCTGTASNGIDEVKINEALTAATASGTIGGRVLLLEGTYWRGGPITCDYDYTVLEGQGAGTVISVPTSGTPAAGYASIIFGNTRTLTDSSIRHLRVQPQGSGTDLVSGAGHGIAFRSVNGRLDNVTVQSSDLDGWRIGGCANTSLQVTITSAVSAPAALTAQTWNVSAAPSLPPLPCIAKVVSTSYSPAAGFSVSNDDSLETVAVTGGSGTSVDVVRGWDSTPITSYGANDANLVPIDFVYEIHGSALDTIYPGGTGMVIDASVQNCEFFRCVVNGGGKLGTPRGTDGFRAFGGINKLVACHAYFNQANGLNLPCTGVGGMGGMQVIGGEYETNGLSGSNGNPDSLSPAGGYGISMANTYYMQVTQTTHYANYTGDIYLDECDRTFITGISSLYDSGNPSFQHINAVGSQRTHIADSLFQLGESTAIEISGFSYGTSVQDNTVYGLDPSQSGAYAIALSGCVGVSVTGNTVDRSIVESGTQADFNLIRGNRLLQTNTSVTTYVDDSPVVTGYSLPEVTTSGAHTMAYANTGVSDVITLTGSTPTATLRKTHLVSAASGNVTVTIPGAGTFGQSSGVTLASASQGLSLPQSTLSVNGGGPAYVPIAGDVMIPVTGGAWSKVSYSSISGAVMSGCIGGSGTTASGDVYLLPEDGEEFSIARTDSSGNTVTIDAPGGSTINGGSSAALSAGRMYRVVLNDGNWTCY